MRPMFLFVLILLQNVQALYFKEHRSGKTALLFWVERLSEKPRKAGASGPSG